MTEKRRHIVLSINDKLKIISCLKSGKSATKLGNEFNVENSMIKDNKDKNENKLIHILNQLKKLEAA